MAITENFKSECLRIINDWKILLNEKWGKVSHVELSTHLDTNKERVLQDPFYLSFKTTRTLEELRWMAEKLIESRQDDKQGLGWYYIQLYRDKTSYASSVMYYVSFLERRFLNCISIRTNKLIGEEAKIKNDLTVANNKITTLTNNQKPSNFDEIKKIYDEFVQTYPKNTVHDVSEYTRKAREELDNWNKTFPTDKYPKGVESVKTELDTTTKDKKQAEEDLKKLQDERKELAEIWKTAIVDKYDFPPLGEKGIKEAGKSLVNWGDIIINTNKAWKENGLDKYGAKPNTESIKELKADLDKLTENQEKHTDYDQIKENLKLANDEKKELADLWEKVVNHKVNWKPFGKEGIKEIGDLINSYNDLLKETRMEWEKQGLTKYGWRPNIESIQALKIDLDKITDLTSQLTTANNSITDLTTSNKNKDKTISDLNHTIKDKDKIIDDDKQLDKKIKDLNKQLVDKDAELTKRNNDITNLTNEKKELEKKIIQDGRYLKALLEIKRQEITKRTELFYQDLSLDNNWVNEIYGDPNVNYLDRLKDLNGDSKTEEVINSFRVVALIKAVQKAQETTDKNKDKLTELSPMLKRIYLDNFDEIKKTWQLLSNEPIVEANNPLYLPIVKEAEKYKEQLNEIINLWQSA